MNTEPWIAAIDRFIRAKERPDPNSPKQLIYWTRADLAQAAGIRPNTLSEIMRAKRDPSIATLTQIAHALGVPRVVLLMTAAEADAHLRTHQAADAVAMHALASVVADIARDVAETKQQLRLQQPPAAAAGGRRKASR